MALLQAAPEHPAAPADLLLLQVPGIQANRGDRASAKQGHVDQRLPRRRGGRPGRADLAIRSGRQDPVVNSRSGWSERGSLAGEHHVLLVWVCGFVLCACALARSRLWWRCCLWTQCFSRARAHTHTHIHSHTHTHTPVDPALLGHPAHRSHHRRQDHPADLHYRPPLAHPALPEVLETLEGRQDRRLRAGLAVMISHEIRYNTSVHDTNKLITWIL